ncbi:MAG: hypothetical protein DLM67_11375 [Candidatus Nephthysia bennettiae]|uniref:Uncharacterized protein n=1 Tax=Candidatus Nephthysia bennettiae TaxID=3127016 RepID=A0A934K747_9BACT|nr:hypothetical protein [Candidatus Dormibacteraeota bacterium]PZR95281.1 MAG: hypothetical protein DLM67_11375 [Candidatus Dormibacteraeota bacterium]
MPEYMVVEQHQLIDSSEFEGHRFGTGVSFILVDMPPGRLKQVDIHLSPTIVTEWLDRDRGAQAAEP